MQKKKENSPKQENKQTKTVVASDSIIGYRWRFLEIAI